MRKESFFELLGDVDPALVQEAEQIPAARRRWRRTAAACLSAAVVLAALLRLSAGRNTPAPIETLDRAEAISLQVKHWQPDGFVGMVVEGGSLFQPQEEVTVRYENTTQFLSPDGGPFICGPGQSEDGLMQVVFKTYADGSGGGTIYAEQVAQTGAGEDPAPPEPVSYEIYEPFGLQYDEERKTLSFEGELVRYFCDSVELNEGTAVRCEFLNEQGTVDVHTLRRPTQNPDGSTDPFGELLGLQRDSQEEFDRRDLSALFPADGVTMTAVAEGGEADPNAQSFADRFAVYQPYGITYEELPGASGAGNVYYRGQLVDVFVDQSPGGGVFSFQSSERGEIRVRTTYNSRGRLSGVQVVE